MLAEAPHIGIDGHQSRRPLQRPSKVTAGRQTRYAIAPSRDFSRVRKLMRDWGLLE
jgi:hypothetical protein